MELNIPIRTNQHGLFHLNSDRNFRNFWLNGRHPRCRKKFHVIWYLKFVLSRHRVKSSIYYIIRMTNQLNTTTVCGLPAFAGLPANNGASYINDVLAFAVNIPLSIFAFLSNLAIIVTVVKTPALQRPSNVLLCSLAATDCLTGITSQPVFFISRLMLPRSRQLCDFQRERLGAPYLLNTLCNGLSYAMLTLISFDRARALADPISYRAQVSKKGMTIARLLIPRLWQPF